MTITLRRDPRTVIPDFIDWFEEPFLTLRPYLGQAIRIEDYTEDGHYVVRAEIAGIDQGRAKGCREDHPSHRWQEVTRPRLLVRCPGRVERRGGAIRIVAALGGNALLQRGESPDPDIRESHVRSVQTRGMTGYRIAQALSRTAPDRQAACLVCRPLVSADDPAMSHPAKFVGPVYGELAACRPAAGQQRGQLPGSRRMAAPATAVPADADLIHDLTWDFVPCRRPRGQPRFRSEGR